MQVQHPRADGETFRPIAVDVAGERVVTNSDGIFEVPDDARGWLERFARAYDADPDALIQEQTCDVVKHDGEVCGRDLPCQYHSEEA